ncbi:MAG: hypothetical protein ACR2NW_03390 [Thermodesulfobacteriota bacterium]
MEEYWGATKENLIENLGDPVETSENEQSGLEELIYVFPPKEDFQPQKEVTYGFYNNSLVIISTGYDFNEKLFKQFELYHKSLEDDWTKKLDSEPTKPTDKDDEGNIVTIWNANNSEIVLFFSNDPTNPQLVVIQTYKPAN